MIPADANRLFSALEKTWTTNPYFNFTSADHYINNAADVAFIMRQLQFESNEHFFCVHVRSDGTFRVQWISSGNNSATLVSLPDIIAGALHFKSETVYTVHNHPSGSLEASAEDIKQTKIISNELYKFNIDSHHIILNLNSGKFALLQVDNKETIKNDIPDNFIKERYVTIHSFSRHVFNQTFNPDILNHQHLVAELLSAYRFSSGSKTGALFLNNRNNVVANYLYDTFSGSPEDCFKTTTEIAVLHNSSSVIFYGTKPLTKELFSKFFEIESMFNGSFVSIRDYIQVSEDTKLTHKTRSGLYYQSVHEFSYNELPFNRDLEFLQLEEPIEKYSNPVKENFIRLESSLKALSNAIQNSDISETNISKISEFPGLGFAWSYILNHQYPDSWKKYEVPFHQSLDQVYNIITNDLSLSKTEVESTLNSLTSAAATSFYTPEPIANTIIKNLTQLVPLNPSVLDPSAGTGVFLKAVSEQYHRFSAVGIEKDILTGLILKNSLYHDNITIINKPFEQVSLAANKFNLIISNIPFGDFYVYDKGFSRSSVPAEKLSCKRIHNYYFIKNAGLLAPDGVMAFITTSGFVNSLQNRTYRDYLVKHNDLLCNITLPNNLFKDSNTAVGSHLVILKRNDKKNFISSFEQSFIENNHPMFFPAGERANVIATAVSMEKNQYGESAPYCQFSGTMEELCEQLGQTIVRQLEQYFNLYREQTKDILPEKLFSDNVQLSLFDTPTQIPSVVVDQAVNKTSPEQINTLIPEPVSFTLQSETFYKPGWLVTNGNHIGYWPEQNHNDFTTAEISIIQTPEKVSLNKTILLLSIRDSFLRLYNSESSNRSFTNTKERTRLNELYNEFRRVSRTYINHRDSREILNFTRQKSFFKNLERLSTTSGLKPVELFSTPIFLKKTPQSLTATEALAYSLNNTSRVSFSVMRNITGMDRQELIESLKGQIFYNPASLVFEEKSFFLSGEVVEKLNRCKEFLQHHTPEHERYQNVSESYEALKKVIPEKIPFEDISIQLGNPWLPVEYYTAFAQKIFNEPSINVLYLQSSHEFSVSPKDCYNSLITTTYALNTEFRFYSGLHIFQMALNDDLPNITKSKELPDGTTIKITDNEKITVLRQKIDDLHNKFNQFLFALPKEDKDKISAIYNKIYNSYVTYKADGSHLTLDDLHFFKDTIYPYQKNAAWHIISNKGGIIDLPPGAGKTLIFSIAAHEMKRMHLCEKPLVICLKSNIQQVVSMYQLSYPHDNILFPDEKDFSTANRDNILYQMANNNWDCIFLTHEQFAEITPCPETENRLIENELKMVQLDLLALTKNNPSKRQLKGLQKRQENLEARLLMAADRLNRKAEILSFDRLGIDKLFVDESQFFKNLTFSTRHQQISGIGNPEGSLRAFNLLIAVRYLQHSNNRDFGTSFLTGSTISNSIAEMYLLFKYMIPDKLEAMRISNFDAWAKTFATKSSEYEFSVTTEFKMKTRFRTFNNVPELSNLYNSITYFIHPDELNIEKPAAIYKQIVIPQTPEQAELTQKLIRFAKDPNPAILGLYHITEEQAKNAKMLICTDIGKKMSLDMRMVYPDAEDHPQNKLSVCATEIAKRYKLYDSVKGTQLVFCDTGTPSGQGFNAYAELKRKLVDDHLMPPSQIAFVHEATSALQKNKLMAAINSGEIRVLIGSTRKLGTGTNCQERVVAMHSLDAPWTPAEMDQRTGRGARQGNTVAPVATNNKVEHLFYNCEKSLDIFRYQVLDTKQNFIDQLKQNKVGLRVISESSMDESSAMSYGQFIATLTGNPLLFENQKLIISIASLESEKRSFYSEQYRIRSKHDNLILEKQSNEKTLNRLLDDRNFLNHNPVPVIDGKKIYTFSFRDKQYQGTEAFGETFKKFMLSPELPRFHNQTVGHFRGFEIAVQFGKVFLSRPGSHHKYNYEFDFSVNEANTCGRYPVQCLMRIDQLIPKYELRIAENSRDITLLSSEEEIQQWPKEHELNALKARKYEVEKEIEISESKDNEQTSLNMGSSFNEQHSEYITPKKELPVIILPLSEEQHTARKNFSGDLSHLATPEQLNAIPDVIKGLYISKEDKLVLLGLNNPDNELKQPITDKLNIDSSTNQLIYSQWVYVDQDYSQIVEHKSVITHKDVVYHNPNFISATVTSQLNAEKINPGNNKIKSLNIQ